MLVMDQYHFVTSKPSSTFPSGPLCLHVTCFYFEGFKSDILHKANYTLRYKLQLCWRPSQIWPMSVFCLGLGLVCDTSTSIGASSCILTLLGQICGFLCATGTDLWVSLCWCTSTDSVSSSFIVTLWIFEARSESSARSYETSDVDFTLSPATFHELLLD